MGGGNVVQASETLKEGDLKRNGVASAEAIYDLVYNGKGKMPGYGLTCAPKVQSQSLIAFKQTVHFSAAATDEMESLGL